MIIMKKYAILYFVFLCNPGIMKSQIQYPSDRNEFFQNVIQAGYDSCSEELESVRYCIYYDSVAKDYLSRLHNAENIIILSVMNVKPLQSVLDIKFTDFSFMDSFSSYFEFKNDSLPVQVILKDKKNDLLIGTVNPKTSFLFSPSFNDPTKEINEIPWTQDMTIIYGLSHTLSLNGFYDGAWHLKGEKLFINVGGKEIPAREYFEKHGDIKKVKWSKHIIEKYRRK